MSRDHDRPREWATEIKRIKSSTESTGNQGFPAVRQLLAMPDAPGKASGWRVTDYKTRKRQWLKEKTVHGGFCTKAQT